MSHQCPLCGATTNQPICSKCWKAYVDDLHSLFTMLPQVERLSRREEHIGGRQQGHVPPVFASAPVDFSAMDLLTETMDVLEEVCRHASLWGGSWRKLIKMMLTHRLQVTQSRDLLGDRERISRLEQKIRLRLTPPEERIIIGECLTKDCGTLLSIVRGQDHVVCSKCLALHSVIEVRDKRLEKLRGRWLPSSPNGAAKWIRENTGIRCSRHVVSMWLQRGSLPSTAKLTPQLRGGYWFNQGELFDAAMRMR